MTYAEKLAKISAINNANVDLPIPNVPQLRLSDAFRARFPEDAQAVDQFNSDLQRFFKEVPYRRD